MELNIDLLKDHFKNRNKYFKNNPKFLTNVNRIKKNLKTSDSELFFIRFPSLNDYTNYKISNPDNTFLDFLDQFYEKEFKKNDHELYYNKCKIFNNHDVRSIFTELEIDLEQFISTCENEEDKEKLTLWGDLWNFLEKPTISDYINMTLEKTDDDVVSHHTFIKNWYLTRARTCDYKKYFIKPNCENLAREFVNPVVDDEDFDEYLKKLTDEKKKERILYCKNNYRDEIIEKGIFKKNKFEMVDNSGGGNCFFLALYDFLFIEEALNLSPEPISLMRKQKAYAPHICKIRQDCTNFQDSINTNIEGSAYRDHILSSTYTDAYYKINDLPDEKKANCLNNLFNLYKIMINCPSNHTSYHKDAGDPEFIAMSIKLNRQIIILKNDESRKTIYKNSSPTVILDSKPIYIYHITFQGGSGHFEALIPKKYGDRVSTLNGKSSRDFGKDNELIQNILKEKYGIENTKIENIPRNFEEKKTEVLDLLMLIENDIGKDDELITKISEDFSVTEKFKNFKEELIKKRSLPKSSKSSKLPTSPKSPKSSKLPTSPKSIPSIENTPDILEIDDLSESGLDLSDIDDDDLSLLKHDILLKFIKKRAENRQKKKEIPIPRYIEKDAINKSIKLFDNELSENLDKWNVLYFDLKESESIYSALYEDNEEDEGELGDEVYIEYRKKKKELNMLEDEIIELDIKISTMKEFLLYINENNIEINKKIEELKTVHQEKWLKKNKKIDKNNKKKTREILSEIKEIYLTLI